MLFQAPRVVRFAFEDDFADSDLGFCRGAKRSLGVRRARTISLPEVGVVRPKVVGGKNAFRQDACALLGKEAWQSIFAAIHASPRENVSGDGGQLSALVTVSKELREIGH